jgi:hypothetical protein
MILSIDVINFDIEDFEDEIVLVNFKTGIYYTILEKGVEIFRALHNGVDENVFQEQICKKLNEVEQNLFKEFLNELHQEGILVQTEKSDILLFDDSSILFNGNSTFVINKFDDISSLVKLDPIHEVSKRGWPNKN